MDIEVLLKDVRDYCEENIVKFHEKRILKLAQAKLTDIIKRKNPYLYKAKGMENAYEIVKGLVDYYLASQEETIFGNWLEELAIFVCSRVYGGRKSSSEGIDLEFEREGVRYFVSIKSGPNWGNSSQIKQMEKNFEKIKRILPKGIKAEFVEGCCYGRCGVINKGFYYKYCGKDFWELISGIEDFYILVVEPIGYKAKEKNKEYQVEYEKLLNRLTKDFSNLFCRKDGSINWETILKFTSLKDYKLKRRGAKDERA